MAQIVKRVGPCTLQPRRDYFVALCKAIYGQQLSTQVAAVLFARFCSHFPATAADAGPGREPAQGPERRWRCGLSRQKAAYLADLAGHLLTGGSAPEGWQR